MVPAFNRVALTLKDLIEDKVNAEESKINFTSILSKATLDIIGIVGEKLKIFSSVLIFLFSMPHNLMFCLF